MARTDYTTKRFGSWIAICFDHRKSAAAYWLCRCDCGTEKVVNMKYLKGGISKSCGCRMAEFVGNANRLLPGRAAMHKCLLTYKSNAKARDLEFSLTDQEFLKLTTSNCYYCNKLPSQVVRPVAINSGDFICNGIDRIDNNQGYHMQNCVPCCLTCNMAKGMKTTSEFFSWVSDIYNHLVSLNRLSPL
jgi:hypothetical protein